MSSQAEPPTGSNAIDLQNHKIISQGAEAIIYVDNDTICKYRPAKSWRLPELDTQLRKKRANQEARVLRKLASKNVNVPNLLEVNLDHGIIRMSLVDGKSLKQTTWENQNDDYSVKDTIANYYSQLGEAVAKMHAANIVHGDLTTSNAMVTPSGQVYLIDFGLSTQAASAEEKAVDLYVLERAIQSTHSQEAEELMTKYVMPAYTSTSTNLKTNLSMVLSKLEATRKRGRKRTQLG